MAADFLLGRRRDRRRRRGADALSAAVRLRHGLAGVYPGADYRYAMGMGASLMLGWTALLLWADRKPLARKGVLLLTVFPVIAGLAANEAYAIATGFLALSAVLPIWALQAALSALFLVSYWRAGKEDL